MRKYFISETDYNKLVQRYGADNKTIATIGPFKSQNGGIFWGREVSKETWHKIQGMLRPNKKKKRLSDKYAKRNKR